MAQLIFYVAVVVAVFLTGLPSSGAFPDGAPPKTCVEGGFPHHHGASPQTVQAPYAITVNKTNYDPGDVIEVILTATEADAFFLGFQLHALRTAGDREEVIGRFIQVPDDAQTQSWYHDDLTRENCVTHVKNDEKTRIRVLWQAPTTSQGDLVFISSFLRDFEHFWTGVTSSVIQANLPSQSPRYEPLLTDDVEPLSVSEECGVSKGCFLYPEGCSGEEDCDFVVAYIHKPNEDAVHFQILGGDADYVAVGFSSDKRMGEDETYHCLEKDGNAALYHGYSPKLYNNRHRLKDERKVSVGRVDGRVKCSFVRPLVGKIHFNNREEQTVEVFEYDFRKNWYLQVAWGSLVAGTEIPQKHTNLPIVSDEKVNFTQFKVVSGETIPFEIKLHGTFGLAAWFLLASIGMILARHFREELKRPLLGIAMWFQFHRSVMLMTFICSVIGIIIIFVHYGGWTPNKEAEAHAIIGLVATSLGLINIIAGFLRPGLTSKWRPFYNWGHRFGAVAAVVLAVTCVFLGVNFNFFKEAFQRKETITLAVWVAVQVVWEVVFEIIRFMQKPNAEETSPESMKIQDPDSGDTRQGATVKLVLLPCFCLCQLAFFAAAFYFIFDIY